MNKLDLSLVDKRKDFMIINSKTAKIVFTNAEQGRSFNRNNDEGIKELNSLTKEFNVNDVIYLKQVHSDNIFVYKKDGPNIKDNEGDAIITNEKGVVIGVFTADCVPIILVDENKGVGAAIHSGWRGTFDSITFKTIKRMEEEYNIDVKDIKAYIGPHIRKCCYEVSEELKLQFINKKHNIDEKMLYEGRNLNLEACILDDLKRAGVCESNISTLGLCTYCDEDIKLHSYRKSAGAYGRMFAFITLN